MAEFDVFLAAVKSGSLSGAALDNNVAKINALLERWAGPDEAPSPDDAKPADAAAEEPNVEPPSEEPTPKPKKKPAPGG
jgi:outer membrane biosynthesis protein TonB